jgi:SulP family sulfate permease
MDVPSSTVRQHTRLAAWAADELRPEQLVRSLVAALLGYMLQIMFVLSFAALLFAGPLANQLSSAIGLLLVGDAVLVLVVALLSSYAGSIAVSQDVSGAILATTVAAVTGAMAGRAGPADQLATIIILIVGTSLITGLCLLLLGYFRLGGLVRFLPYPVMGGFLAGTGWLLLKGGIGVMADPSLGAGLLAPLVLAHWLPGLVFGIVLLAVVKRSAHPLVLPGVFCSAAGMFYLVSWLSAAPPDRLGAQGWLLGPFPSSGLWQFPLSAARLSHADWLVLAGQSAAIVPILLVSMIALLLNASGLELVAKRDINLNHELMIAGAANLLGGLCGGMVGYHAISLSTLNHTASGGKRLPGVLIAVGVGLTVWLGAAVFAYLPKFLLGGLLIFLGLALLIEWVYQAWFTFSKIEFVIILVILAVIAARGFLEGIGVGLVAAIGLFVINYSRIDVVKHALSGASYQSRVTRSHAQQQVLAVHGDQIVILRLQGFIFFGTANRLFERLRERALQVDAVPMRFAVLDFAQVSGLDSTALLSFSKMVQLARAQRCVLVLTGLSAAMRDQMARGGLVAEPGVIEICSDLDYGVEWCENQIIAQLRLDEDQASSLQDQWQYIVPNDEQLAALIGYLKRREVAPGEYIIRQGDPPDLIFFIERGQVTARLESDDRPPVRLETMRGGRTVGELGFYLGSRRTAAVVADQPSTIYFLSKRDLEQIEENDPAAAYTFHRVIAHLLGERTVHLIRAVDALRK